MKDNTNVRFCKESVLLAGNKPAMRLGIYFEFYLLQEWRKAHVRGIAYGLL